MSASVLDAYDLTNTLKDRLPAFLVWNVSKIDGTVEMVAGHQMTIVDGALVFYVVYLWKDSPMTKIVRSFSRWDEVVEVSTVGVSTTSH